MFISFHGILSDGVVDIPLQAAHLLRAQLAAAGRNVSTDLNKANSFFNPAGRETAHGWIVVGRADLDTLDLNSLQSLSLSIDDVVVDLFNLVITREPMSFSPAFITDDPLAVYLVELADSRWRVSNPYFCVSIAAMYNVPSSAPATYLSSSRNSGSDWTWETMAEDIWNTMVDQLGTFPGLPFTPNGAPVGWIFQGVSAWDALCDVLDRIGCTVSADLTMETDQYLIVQIGDDDVEADAILAGAAEVKIHDAEFMSIERGKFPFGVSVFFHKQLSTPTSIPPFLMNSVYSVDIDGTITNAEDGVYHPIWDELPALVDGSGTVTNTTALRDRAQERADDFYRMGLEGGTRFWQRFSGLLELVPGPKIKSVTYCSTEAGVFTDVFGHPTMPVIGEAESRDYADAGTVQDLVRLGFPATGGGLSSIIAHTAATFVVPAVASTVSVNITSVVDTSIWAVIGQTIEIYDGTHQAYGYITAIADATHFTFQTTRVAMGSAGNTMAIAAQVIISGDPVASSVSDWNYFTSGIMNNVAQAGYGEKTSIYNGSGGWKSTVASAAAYAKISHDRIIVDNGSGGTGVTYAQLIPGNLAFFTGNSAAIYSTGGIRFQNDPGSGPTRINSLIWDQYTTSFVMTGVSLDPSVSVWNSGTTYVSGNEVSVIDPTTGKRQGYKANATNTNDDPNSFSGNWDATVCDPGFAIRDNAGSFYYGITTTIALAKVTTLGANGSITITGGFVTGYTAPT